MTHGPKKIFTAGLGALCVTVFSACASRGEVAATAANPRTRTPSPTAESTAAPTMLPTAAPTAEPATLFPGVGQMCRLMIHGTYSYPWTDSEFLMGPGKHLFYDSAGGGVYGNDQAGCELNADCTLLRATNVDSANPDRTGVFGPWVDSRSGVSAAQWHEFTVKCSYCGCTLPATKEKVSCGEWYCAAGPTSQARAGVKMYCRTSRWMASTDPCTVPSSGGT